MNGPSNLNYSTEDFLNSGCIYELTAGRCFERYDSRSLQHPIHQDEILPVGPGRFSSGGLQAFHGHHLKDEGHVVQGGDPGSDLQAHSSVHLLLFVIDVTHPEDMAPSPNTVIREQVCIVYSTTTEEIDCDWKTLIIKI
ncbi:uncharacterized protein LOC110832105 isoform X2 [Zootermopsis nevadensis]|nr:uncharacterized protein LOC110832105 isoform X2 [Zootermopsis nevadensis]